VQLPRGPRGTGPGGTGAATWAPDPSAGYRPAAGTNSLMHIKKAFAISDIGVARSVVRDHPFATLVTGDLRATHMPCLVDEDAEPLTILGHVARADPIVEALGGPMLAIFQGPHGYVSASWYATETIPTWNYLTLHIRGRPELLGDAMPVLAQTVSHFEAAVEEPWSLDSAGDTTREMADQVIAFRLEAQSWHGEAKLSQDKPAEERAHVLAGLEHRGPYSNLPLAATMRRFAR
jgi:transcriptional regulator